MNNAGKLTFFSQVFRFHFKSGRFKSVILCRLHYVFRVGTVSGNAAVEAHLLKRDPLVVIRKHHCQACCPALKRFHLHHDGNLGDSFLDRLFIFYLFRAIHCYLSFDTSMNEIGRMVSVVITA